MAAKCAGTVVLEKSFAYPYVVIDKIIKEKVTGFPIVPTILAIILQLKDLKKYKPKLVIIEYNPTIPPHLEAIQKRGGYLGSSALSIVNLGRDKGSKLQTVTVTILFLV